ncbi:MAG TPA: PAS domain-containing sensor histidine kinase, partial [Terriglobales bacterium]
VEVSLSPLETADGTVVTSTIRDISLRKAAEQTMKVQAELLNAAQEAIWVADSNHRITYWNKGAERLYGWRREEVLGKSPHQLLQTEFPVPLEEIERHLQEGGWHGELSHTTRDGRKVVVASSWTTLKDAPHQVGWLQISTDITLRKQAEEATRRLGGRLLILQDAERRRFARELHDSLGQYLTSLKINLDLLLGDTVPRAGQAEIAKECLDMLDKCLAETRTMSYLLHPPLLDETGFASAARWYVEGFAQRSGISAKLNFPSDLPRLPRDVETALFRVLQECLTNVHRHSGSGAVDITLTIDSARVTLRVTDYGRGIPRERLEQFRRVGVDVGVGLGGMRERAHDLGGSLEVESNGEQGTIVTLTVPLPQTVRSAGDDASGGRGQSVSGA